VGRPDQLRWRSRVVGRIAAFDHDLVRCALKPLAYVALGAVFLALRWVNRHKAEPFEGAPTDETKGPRWRRDVNVLDPDFFSHARSYRKLFRAHSAIAVLALVAVGILGSVHRGPRTGIGPAIFAVAVIQAVILTGWWIVALVRDQAVQVALATIGTVLCHAPFSGAGQLAIDRLSHWPKPHPGMADLPLHPGPELEISRVFFIALAIGAVAMLAVLAVAALQPAEPQPLELQLLEGQPLDGQPLDGQPPDGGPDKEPLVARIVRRHATHIAVAVGLAFLVAVDGFAASQLVHLTIMGHRTWWDPLRLLYDTFTFHPSAAEHFGALALVALPISVAVIIRKPREGRLVRVLGNVWDVLTFWPRRYNPFGVPPYAERAVPELRALVRHRRDVNNHQVVVGHSQGSVLAFAAIGAELRLEADAAQAKGVIAARRACGKAKGAVSFVTFGSPLGTLYEKFFPHHMGPNVRADVALLIERSGGRWHNLWRSTDAISGAVNGDGKSQAIDCRLKDPTPDPMDECGETKSESSTRAESAARTKEPPLERPRPWGVVSGHGYYLADPVTKATLKEIKAMTDGYPPPLSVEGDD
jgi:hypothetical protein